MNEAVNPFRPPQSNVELDATSAPLAMRAASRGRRFGTLVVDYIGFMALAIAVGLVLGFVFGDEGLQALQRVPEMVFGAALMIAYYLFFEGLWARTPGKWVFGTVVVDENGAKPRFGQVIGRTLCRFIPFEAFSVFGERGWHDKIPKTRVVMARD